MKRVTWLAVGIVLGVSSHLCRADQVPSTPAQGQLALVPADPLPNVARLSAGVGLYNSGWFTCYYYPYYACGAGNYTSYVPFTLGVQVDIHLREQSYLTPGFNVMTGTANNTYYVGNQAFETSNYITLWEPTLDYVARIGQFNEDTLGRLRLGGAFYFGSDGNWGGGFRLGAGVSFFNTKRVGIGLDFVFEGASYNGYWLGGLQLLASPEFHF